MLAFAPDRLGHVVNLRDEDYAALLARPIFIEMCPTSNMYTRSIAHYGAHPFKHVRRRFAAQGNALYPMLFKPEQEALFAHVHKRRWWIWSGCCWRQCRESSCRRTLRAVHAIAAGN